jgi:hypothetical protein
MAKKHSSYLYELIGPGGQVRVTIWQGARIEQRGHNDTQLKVCTLPNADDDEEYENIEVYPLPLTKYLAESDAS